MIELKHYRFWVQSVLPLVYDDSLSYYEVLAKCVHYINNLIDNDNEMLASMEEMQGAIEELRQIIEDAGIADINELIERVSTLETKTEDLPNYETNNPLMDGTASAGSSTKYSRGDHVHPIDTSRASTESVISVKNMVTNRNLLDNWYFVGGGSQLGDGVFPINQRGQTSYLGTNLGIDRWYVTSGSSSQVTIDADGIIYKNTVKTNRFSQHAPISIAGKTVTLSALCTPIDGARYTVTIQTNTDNSSATFTTEKLTSVTFTVPSTATEINAQIRMENDGTSVKIHAIKLELGDTQTLAHQENGEWVLNEIPDYGEELAKCQRYFLKIDTRGATALGCGYSNGTENIRISIPLPVTMAASVSSTPTVTVSDLSLIRLVGNGQLKTPLSIAGAYLTGNCITIDFKVSETAENVTYTLKPVAATIYVSI